MHVNEKGRVRDIRINGGKRKRVRGEGNKNDKTLCGNKLKKNKEGEEKCHREKKQLVEKETQTRLEVGEYMQWRQNVEGGEKGKEEKGKRKWTEGVEEKRKAAHAPLEVKSCEQRYSFLFRLRCFSLDEMSCL